VTNTVLSLRSQLDAINLSSGSSLTINGKGGALFGGGNINGLRRCIHGVPGASDQ